MIRYQLIVCGCNKEGEMCPIGYQMFDNKEEARLQGQAVCDALSSLTGIYTCYMYDVDELEMNWT